MVSPNDGRKAPISILLVSLMVFSGFAAIVPTFPTAGAVHETLTVSIDTEPAPSAIQPNRSTTTFSVDIDTGENQENPSCSFDWGGEDISSQVQGTCADGVQDFTWTPAASLGPDVSPIEVTVETTGTSCTVTETDCEVPGLTFPGDEETASTDEVIVDGEAPDLTTDSVTLAWDDPIGDGILTDGDGTSDDELGGSTTIGPGPYDISFTPSDEFLAEAVLHTGQSCGSLSEEATMGWAQGSSPVDPVEFSDLAGVFGPTSGAFEIVYTDQSGNEATAGCFTVDIDTDPPDLTIHNAGLATSPGTAHIGPVTLSSPGNFTVSDPGGDPVHSLTLTVNEPDGETTRQGTETGGDWSVIFPADTLTPGVYDVDLTAEDVRGNTITRTVEDVRVDPTEPELVTITFQAVDETTGEAKQGCELRSFGENEEPLNDLNRPPYCSGPYDVTVTIREEFPEQNPTVTKLLDPPADVELTGADRSGDPNHENGQVDEITWTYTGVPFPEDESPVGVSVDLAEDHGAPRTISGTDDAPFAGFPVEEFPRANFIPETQNIISDGSVTFRIVDETVDDGGEPACPSPLPNPGSGQDGTFCQFVGDQPSLTLIDGDGDPVPGVTAEQVAAGTWDLTWEAPDEDGDGTPDPVVVDARLEVESSNTLTGVSEATMLVNDPGAPTILEDGVRVANWDPDNGEWTFSDTDNGPFAATGRMLVEVSYESFSVERFVFTLEEDGSPGNNAEWTTDVQTTGDDLGDVLVATGNEPIVHLAENVPIAGDTGDESSTGAGCLDGPTPLFWGQRTCYFWIETKSIDRAVQSNLPTLEDDTLYDIRVELIDATGGDSDEILVDPANNEGVRAEGFNMVIDALTLSPADESRQDNPFSNGDFLEVGFSTNLTAEITDVTNSSTEDGDDDETIWNRARAWTCLVIPRDLPNQPAPSQDDLPLTRYLSSSMGAPTCYPVHKPTEGVLNPRSHGMENGNGPLLLGTGPDGDQNPEGAMFRLDFSISQLLAEDDPSLGPELREALTGIGSGQENLLDKVLVRTVIMDEHGNVEVLHLPSSGHTSTQGLDLSSFEPKIKARNTASLDEDLGPASHENRAACVTQDNADACEGMDGFFRSQTLRACVQPALADNSTAGHAFPANTFRTDEDANGDNTRANPCYRGLQLIPNLGAQDPYGEIIIPISLDNFGTQPDDITVRWGYISGPTDWDVILQRGTQSADDRFTVPNVAARDSADDPGTTPMELRIRPAPDAVGGERLRLNVTLWSDASARLPQDQQRENLILEAILLPLERAELTIGSDKTQEILETTEPEETFEVPLHIKNDGNTDGKFDIALADPNENPAYTSAVCSLASNTDDKINIRTLVDGDERESVFLEAGANRTVTLSVNVGRDVEASNGFPYDCTFVVEKNDEVITALNQAPTLSLDVIGVSDVRIWEVVTDDGILSDRELTDTTITRVVPPSQLADAGLELPLYIENAGSVAIEPLVQLREQSVTGNLNAQWTATAADGATLQEADFEDIFSLSISDGDDPTQVSDMEDVGAFDPAEDPLPSGFERTQQGEWFCVSKDGPTSDGDTDTDPRSVCKLPFTLNLASATSNPAVIGDELVYEFSFGESGVSNPATLTVRVLVGHVGEVRVEENSRPVVGVPSGDETSTSRIRLNASLIEGRDFNVLGQGIVEASSLGAQVIDGPSCGDVEPGPESVQTDSDRRTFFEFNVKASFGPGSSTSCTLTQTGTGAIPTYTAALEGLTDPTIAFTLGVQDENGSELRVVHPAHVRFIDDDVPTPDPAASLTFQPQAVQDATGDQYARLGFDVPGVNFGTDPLPDVTLTRERTPTIAFPDSDFTGNATPTDGSGPGSDWAWTRTGAATSLHSTQFQPFHDGTTTLQADGTPQADGAATVWSTQNRNVFVLGGDEGNGPTRYVYEFDPRSREAENLSATLPTPARDMAAVYTGQRVLIFGGASNAPGTTPIDQALEWSPGSTTFTDVTGENDGACTLDRIGAHAVWTGQQAFLFGGTSDGTSVVPSVCSYDPTATQTDSFRSAGTLPSGWTTVAGAAWDGEFIYVVGGQTQADTVAVYDANLERFLQDPFDLPGPGGLIDGGLIWMGDQFLFLLDDGTAQVWHDEDLPTGTELPSMPLTSFNLPTEVDVDDVADIRPVWTGYLGYFLNVTAGNGNGSVVQFSLGGHVLDTRTQFGRSSSAVPTGNVTLYTWSDKPDGPAWREGWNPVVLHITDLDGFPAQDPGNNSGVTPSVDFRFVRAADNGKITDTYDLLENFQPNALGGGYYLLNLSIPDGLDGLRNLADRPSDQSNEAGLQWAMRVQLGSGQSIAGDQLRGSAYFTLQDLGLADNTGESRIVPASAFNAGSRLTQGSTVEQHTIAHWGSRFIGGPVDPAMGTSNNRLQTGPGLHDMTVFLFEEQVSTPRSLNLGGLQHQQVRDHDFQPLTGAEPSVAYRPFSRGFDVAGDTATLAEKGSDDPYAYYTAKLNLADLGADLNWLIQLTLDDDQNNRIGKPQANVDVIEDREAASHGLPMPLSIQPPAGAVVDENEVPIGDRAADFDVNPTSDRITLDMRALPGFLPDRGTFTLTPFVRENNPVGTAVGITRGTVDEGEAIDFRIRGQGLLTLSPDELPSETEADIEMELGASISPVSLVDIAQVEIEGEDPVKLTRASGSQYRGTFTPTEIGEIELVFTALDVFGGASTVTRTLDVVENAAPRIGVSSGVQVDDTYFIQAGGQVTFNVTDAGIVGGEIQVFKETAAAEDPDPEPSENADGTLNVTGLGSSLAEGTYPTTVTLVNPSDEGDDTPIEDARVWLNITAPGESESTEVLTETTDSAGEISGSVVLDGTGTHSVTVQARNVTDDGEVEEFEHTFSIEVIDTTAGRTELDTGTPDCEDTQCTVSVASGLEGDGTSATFIVNATDTSGLSRERAFLFQADEGVPTVTLSAGTPSVAGSPPIVGPSSTIEVSASDDGAGVNDNVNLVASRDGEEVGSTTVEPGSGVQVRQFGLEDDGSFQVRAEAEDLLGNSATATQNFELDATGPETETPSFERVASGLRVSVEASDASGVDRVTIQYRVGDSGSFQTASLAAGDEGVHRTTLSGLPETGDLVYSITATDRLENEADTQRTTFSLGDAPTGEDNLPTVTITSPSNGATVEGVIEVNYTLGHPDGVPVSVSTVTMVGAGGTELEPTPGETGVELDTTQLDDGGATIAVTVTDEVGVQATATIQVTVDNQPAVPSCPGQDVRRAGSGVEVCFQLATDASVQEVQVTLVKNGDELETKTLEPQPQGSYQTSFDMEEGSYVLKITKVNEDGTTEEKISEPFVVQSGAISEEPVARLIVAIVLGVLVMAGAAYASFGRWN